MMAEKNLPAGAADEAMAMRAFAHVAADPGLLGALLGGSGMTPAALAAAAQAPGFAVFILDFLMESDDRVSAFATAEGIAPEAVARCRARMEPEAFE